MCQYSHSADWHVAMWELRKPTYQQVRTRQHDKINLCSRPFVRCPWFSCSRNPNFSINGMTRKQFEKLRIDIEAQQFQSAEVNPIAYGIQRLLFEKENLNKLIAIAEKIPMKTTRARVERWKRKLIRADKSLLRFQRMQAEKVGVVGMNNPSFIHLAAPAAPALRASLR